jgi:hypothetical protein
MGKCSIAYGTELMVQPFSKAAVTMRIEELSNPGKRTRMLGELEILKVSIHQNPW